MSLVQQLPALDARLRSLADADRAHAMTAYMQGQFTFLGVPTPQRRSAAKEVLAAAPEKGGPPDHEDLVVAVDSLFEMAEREFHYVAVDLLRRWQRMLTSDDIGWLGALVTTHSWWDSVDALATHPIGQVVLRDRSLVVVTDLWATHDDLWLNRTAILHQLLYKESTDVEQLFRYCDLHAESEEFFLQKAIGWALRQYARTDSEAVNEYVDHRRGTLSNLSIREALKHL